MSKYATKRADGLMAYVITKRTVWDVSRGSDGYRFIEWAESLADAKRQYGWTRDRHTSVYVRRASVQDVAEFGATA